MKRAWQPNRIEVIRKVLPPPTVILTTEDQLDYSLSTLRCILSRENPQPGRLDIVETIRSFLEIGKFIKET